MGPTSIHISQAVNRRAEIEGIAREIRQIVRTKNYRYRDIALLIRNGRIIMKSLSRFSPIIRFLILSIKKERCFNHPLVELIRSVLEVINRYWRYEPVFRAIKTELLYPLGKIQIKCVKRMDRLENYV